MHYGGAVGDGQDAGLRLLRTNWRTERARGTALRFLRLSLVGRLVLFHGRVVDLKLAGVDELLF
jgi:hypothetical protein